MAVYPIGSEEVQKGPLRSLFHKALVHPNVVIIVDVTGVVHSIGHRKLGNRRAAVEAVELPVILTPQGHPPTQDLGLHPPQQIL